MQLSYALQHVQALDHRPCCAGLIRCQSCLCQRWLTLCSVLKRHVRLLLLAEPGTHNSGRAADDLPEEPAVGWAGRPDLEGPWPAGKAGLRLAFGCLQLHVCGHDGGSASGGHPLLGRCFLLLPVLHAFCTIVELTACLCTRRFCSSTGEATAPCSVVLQRVMHCCPLKHGVAAFNS
jgi:hypothetical protein